MLNVDTRRKIDSCRDILVGKLPDPKAQIEQITYALIYKFMADMDTASVALGGKASFFVNGYEQYTWDKLMSTNLGGKQRLDLYSEAIAKLSLNPHLPPLFRDIFKDAFLPYRDPETLNMFLKEISWFTYNHSEDLGDAFEYLLSVMSSQGDAGQFRTPRHIIDFIVAVVDPKKDETILDPACGTAGFLISAYKHILRQNTAEKPGDKLTTDEKKDLMSQIVGYDISPDMVRLSLVNMYLHGFPEPHIFEYDTLTDEGRWEDSFDVIMANPPFMSPKGGIRPHKRFSIQANRSEVLFVDYIAEHLNPDGRAGVIVPEGIIFQSGNAYKSLRKMLVDNYLFCVVSLPAGVFNPYSGVKTSILFMDKTLAKQTDKILFVKIENDGFDLGAQRREIAGSDFPQALKNIKTFHQSVRNSKEFSISDATNTLLVSKQQLAENGDYNLSLERYKIQEVRQTKWPMVPLGEMVDFIGGYAFKSTNMVDSLLDPSYRPVVKIGNVGRDGQIDKSDIQFHPYSNELSRFSLKVDDIVMAMTGATVGKVAVVKQEGLLLNQRVGVLRAKPLVIQKYIIDLLYNNSFYDYCQRTAGGGAQGNISPSEILNYKIPLPPLSIQQEIVSEIESYQKIIEGARQVVSNYKPQIKIDPEWPLRTIGDACALMTGATPSSTVKEYYENGTINWLVSGDIHKGEIYECAKKITQKGLENSNTRLLPINSVLIALNGQGKTRGTVALLRIEATCNQSIVAINPNDHNFLMPEFLYYQLKARYQEIRNITGDNQRSGLNMTIIRNIMIAIPTLSIQQEIVAQIEKEQQLVDANKQLIQIYEQKIKSKIAEVWGK
jgi:type I restriction enzyme M protein